MNHGKRAGFSGAAFWLFFLRAVSLFAGAQAEKPPEYNGVWTLCITDADIASLPPSKAAVSAIASQTLARALSAVDRRVRVSAEEEYYRNELWYTARKEAAKKIADKQNQRDLLVYQGAKSWKYKRDIQKLDKELSVLREALGEAEGDEPLIAREPLFALAADNLAGRFPAPPPPDGEYYFCRQQKIDGFLAARITEFHERIVLEVTLYSLFARAYTYEDTAIFSAEDIDAALVDLAGRLIPAVSQMPSAGIIVTAEPEDAVIAIDNRFAGRGNTDVIERNAGTVSVEVASGDHEPFKADITLPPEELTELSVRLPALPLAGITVDAGSEEALLYRGALYAGTTPLALSAPLGRWLLLMAETPDKRTADAAFAAAPGTVTLKPAAAPRRGDVDKARRGFYGAWGRFWIALPLALVINGMYSNYANALNVNPARTQAEIDDAQRFQWVTIGAGITAGAFGIEFVARLVYYVVISNRPRSPLIPAEQAASPTVEEVNAGAEGAAEGMEGMAEDAEGAAEDAEGAAEGAEGMAEEDAGTPEAEAPDAEGANLP